MGKRYIKTYIVLLIIILTSALNIGTICNSNKNAENESAIQSDSGWAQVPGILKNIIPPKFNDKHFDITKYGAVAGGKILCTNAFKKAIDECSQAGGGIVIVPKVNI